MEITSPRINITCANCTCMSFAFKKLTFDQLKEVDDHRSEIHYEKGEIICKQGSFMDNMMFVKNGLVKLYMESSDRPMILSLVGQGHFLGLPLVFSEHHPVYHFTAQALTESEICEVEVGLFREFIGENHEFSREINKILSQDLIRSHQQMFSLSKKQIRGRFAELILDLKNKFYKRKNFELALSRRDMAELISTSPESISRLIKELKDENILIVDGNDIEILHEEKLKRISLVG